MSGVGSSPALATCDTRKVLLAGVAGGFPGYSRFAPPIDWLVSMSEIILKGTLTESKKKIKKSITLQPLIRKHSHLDHRCPVGLAYIPLHRTQGSIPGVAARGQNLVCLENVVFLCFHIKMGAR